jgi:hypothetical protein
VAVGPLAAPVSDPVQTVIVWAAWFVVGVLVGRWAGVRQTTQRLTADPPHHHDWDPWMDCPIVFYPTWNGLRVADPYPGRGQERRCKTCGETELRSTAGKISDP